MQGDTIENLLKLAVLGPPLGSAGRTRQNTREPRREDDGRAIDDLLLAAFYDDTQYRALKGAGPIRTDYPLLETPLLTLVKELSMRPSIKSFQLRRS